MISSSKIDNLNKKGYFVIKNFLTKKEKREFSETLMKTYSNILSEKIDEKSIHKIVSQYEKNLRYDKLYKAFKKYCSNQVYFRFSKRLTSLSKKIYKNKKFKVVNTGLAIGIKNSNRTSYKWHQEKPYYKDLETIHFQFPVIGSCSKKNGTMSVLEGSHQVGFQKKVNNFKKHEKAINSFIPKNIKKFEKLFKEKFVNLGQRDLVVFSQYLIHKTNKNSSDKVRFAANIRLKIS